MNKSEEVFNETKALDGEFLKLMDEAIKDRFNGGRNYSKFTYEYREIEEKLRESIDENDESNGFS